MIFFVEDIFLSLGGARIWKICPPPPLLLYYIYEKCKPYCKWRGSMPGLSVEIVSVKLILGCIFQIIDFIWTLAMVAASQQPQWISNREICSFPSGAFHFTTGACWLYHMCSVVYVWVDSFCYAEQLYKDYLFSS